MPPGRNLSSSPGPSTSALRGHVSLQPTFCGPIRRSCSQFLRHLPHPRASFPAKLLRSKPRFVARKLWVTSVFSAWNSFGLWTKPSSGTSYTARRTWSFTLSARVEQNSLIFPSYNRIGPNREPVRLNSPDLCHLQDWQPICSLISWFSDCACPKPRGDRQIVGKAQLCPAPVPQWPRVCPWKMPISSSWPTRSRASIILLAVSFSSVTFAP